MFVIKTFVLSIKLVRWLTDGGGQLKATVKSMALYEKTPTLKHCKKKTMAAWTTDPGSWQGDRRALTPLAILLALTGGLILYATLS